MLRQAFFVKFACEINGRRGVIAPETYGFITLCDKVLQNWCTVGEEKSGFAMP